MKKTTTTKTTKTTKTTRAVTPHDSIFALVKSTEAGVAVELYGYGVTSFDPRDVTVTEKRCSTVGGNTSLYLTRADVTRLRRYLVA
jgi:hypothetical protein